MEKMSVNSNMENPIEDYRGLRCRQCDCRHFWVVYTRAAWGGKVVRRRACRGCGARITTWELRAVPDVSRRGQGT